MRLNFTAMALARVLTTVVLARPGTPSRRRWASQSRPISRRRTSSRWPTRTLPISPSTRRSGWEASTANAAAAAVVFMGVSIGVDGASAPACRRPGAAVEPGELGAQDGLRPRNVGAAAPLDARRCARRHPWSCVWCMPRGNRQRGGLGHALRPERSAPRAGCDAHRRESSGAPPGDPSVELPHRGPARRHRHGVCTPCPGDSAGHCAVSAGAPSRPTATRPSPRHARHAMPVRYMRVMRTIIGPAPGPSIAVHGQRPRCMVREVGDGTNGGRRASRSGRRQRLSVRSIVLRD